MEDQRTDTTRLAELRKRRRSHRLARDLAGRARRRFAKPVVHAAVDPSENSHVTPEFTIVGRRIGRARRVTGAAESTATSRYRLDRGDSETAWE